MRGFANLLWRYHRFIWSPSNRNFIRSQRCNPWLLLFAFPTCSAAARMAPTIFQSVLQFRISRWRQQQFTSPLSKRRWCCAIDPLIYNCFTTKERLKHYRFAVNLLKKRGHSLSPDLDKQLYYSFFCTSYDEDRYKILCSLKKQLHKNDIPTNINKLFYLCFFHSWIR